jgi:hypothetical protein
VLSGGGMSMGTRKAIEVLFPHHDDPAYRKLGDLEELVASLTARRATASFKLRLQRAVARVADTLVEYADSSEGAGCEPALLDALLQCRKAASSVEMLYRAGVLGRAGRCKAFELLADIIEILIDRIRSLRGLPSIAPLPRPVFAEPPGTSEAVGKGDAATSKEEGESPPRKLLDS